MSKPEKAGTDDLKRMLRRLERIETEKAERTQARPSGPPRTRDLSSLPPANGRPEMSSAASPPEMPQSSRRRTLVSSLDQVAPAAASIPPEAPKIPKHLEEQRREAERQRVSVLTDPREFTKRGGPKRQGVSAGFVIIAVSIAFLATLGTIWLAGGFDRVLMQVERQISERLGGSDGAPPENVKSTQAGGANVPRFVDGERISPDEGPAQREDPATGQTTPDEAVAPPRTQQNPQTATSSAPPAQEKAASTTPKAASEDVGPPPAPVAALQPPQDKAPGAQLPPASPESIELVGPRSVRAEPNVPLPFPIKLEAGSGDLSGYYLVVSGLKHGSSFSSGIELLFDTWQIPATALSDLQLTTTPGFARHMTLKVELRGPSGDRLKETTVTVDLPGAARQTVSLDGPEASGDRQPSQAAQQLIDRAEVFLDNGSLQGARMLLERAATYGAGYAAMLLATSYDPRYASHFSAGHPQSNVAEAKRWYQRASELGVKAAGPRLNALDAP